MSKRPTVSPLPPPLKSGDFYLENGFMVFTKEYHLQRGFCCKSGCRHCPWDYRKKLDGVDTEDGESGKGT